MCLATVYEKSIDGTGFKPGWLLRYVAKLVVPFWKHWVLRRGMPAGIRLPAFMFKEVAPPELVSTRAAARSAAAGGWSIASSHPPTRCGWRRRTVRKRRGHAANR